MKSFASDNYAGVLPEIMNALQLANEGHARSYGADDITAAVRAQIKELFGAHADAYFVFNGTGANVLSLSCATQSFNAVLCADTSHIYCDESSAPETITGCRFFPLATNNEGKITPESVQERLIRVGDIHYAQATILSITQTTEYGTVYTPEEIKVLAQLAHANGMYFHIDGARFFNAAASLGCSLADISSLAGADILSLGGTKAGMMFGEAVIIFNDKLKQYVGYKHKQVMQLASKTRFIAAQFGAILKDELWRNTALHANAMAQNLVKVLSCYSAITITKPVQANAIFATMPYAWYEKLNEQFPFYIWKESVCEVRIMCSWDTTDTDIEGFKDVLNQLQG